jgi:neprosin-like protein/PEP-CTERM motif-containing protein
MRLTHPLFQRRPICCRRAVIPIVALLVPLAFTAASANAGTAGYLYVGDSDTTTTTEANVNLPINAQTVSDATLDEHSLFEMSMSNEFGASGNIIEIGVTTDIGLNGDSNPHWFVFSWINGVPQGYDSSSHFVSQIGSFWGTSLSAVEGTSEEVEFQYNAPNWDLDLNGMAAGYFPGSEWSGAFTASSVTQVFGEVYQDGTFYPTLNGTVSGYESSGGGYLFTNMVDPPYAQSNASQTGFTASGPTPEPSSVVLLGIALSAFACRRRSCFITI